MKKLYSHNLALCQAKFNEAHGFGRCKERMIQAEECNDLLNWMVEGHLRHCPKRRLVGTRATIHAYTDRMPRSYKWTAMNTVARYHHDGKGWILDDVCREPVKVFSGHIELELSQDTKDYVLSSLCRV